MNKSFLMTAAVMLSLTGCYNITVEPAADTQHPSWISIRCDSEKGCHDKSYQLCPHGYSIVGTYSNGRVIECLGVSQSEMDAVFYDQKRVR